MEVGAAGGAQHVLLHKLLIRLAGNLFDNHRQQQVPEVGIILRGARNELQREFDHAFHQGFLVRRGGQPVLHHHGTCLEERIAIGRFESALVAQQVLDRDFIVVFVLDDFRIGSVVEDARGPEDRVAQAQAALLLQDHDAGGGEEFGYRCHPQDDAGRHPHAFFFIGPPVTLRVQQRIVAHDAERYALQVPLLHEPGDAFVQACQVGGVGHFVGEGFVEVQGFAARFIGTFTAKGTSQGDGCHDGCRDDEEVSEGLF